MSPFCPLDWRWRRAGYLAASGRRRSSSEDPVVKELVKFRIAADRATDERARARLAGRYPALAAARAIYEGSGIQRDELDARLLAGQTTDQIALASGIPIEVVAVYGPAFMDLPPVGAGCDWIVDRVIGMWGWPPPGPSTRQFWLYAAYAGGVSTLEAVMGDDRGTPHSNADERRRFAALVRLSARLDAQVCRPGPLPAALVLEIETVCPELTRPAASDPHAQTTALYLDLLRLLAGLPRRGHEDAATVNANRSPLASPAQETTHA